MGNFFCCCYPEVEQAVSSTPSHGKDVRPSSSRSGIHSISEDLQIRQKSASERHKNNSRPSSSRSDINSIIEDLRIRQKSASERHKNNSRPSSSRSDINSIIEDLRIRQKSASDRHKNNSQQILEDSNGFNIRFMAKDQMIKENQDILKTFFSTNVADAPFFYNFELLRNKVYELEKLEMHSSEYQNISVLFKSSNKSFFKIQKIEKVFNPYLLLQYKLKILESNAKKRYINETLMFHGTRKKNIDSICKHNFNWRFHGKEQGTRNGKGVNFATNAYFATHYGDKGYDKVMLVVNVLIGLCSQGTKDMVIPPLGFDTTTDNRQIPQVFVKYDDNVFYPSYIIYYGGIDHKQQNKNRNVFSF